MPALVQEHSSVLARANTLEVKIASSFAEIDAAMRLRFEVFNLELQGGLASSYAKGYDSDAYDAYCDHLIVKDVLTGEVVGTYRLLRRSRAEQHIGFYSENEFDLTNLKKLPGESLELGRSCVARAHRSFAVINLLWGAIAKYAEQCDARYLFGCGSLHCSSPDEVQPIYAYLRAHHLAPEPYRVSPLSSCRLGLREEILTGGDSRRVLRQLSPLIKGYLRAGALVCGEPAYDVAFGTADVLVLLEAEKLSGRYQAHYLKEPSLS